MRYVAQAKLREEAIACTETKILLIKNGNIRTRLGSAYGSQWLEHEYEILAILKKGRETIH